MTGIERKNRLTGATDAIRRLRLSPYLLSFLCAAGGLGLVFLLARDSLSFLYETQSAGWYGLLASLGRENALAALGKGEDLAFLSFAFNPLNRLLSLFSFSSRVGGVCFVNAIRCGLAAAAFTCFLKQRKTEDLPAVLFSVLYALSSYSFLAQLTGVAVDGLIVLPLLLAGIERIVSRRGLALFSVSLAVCAVVSFRTLFGFFVFSVFWAFTVRLGRAGAKTKTVLFDLLLILLSVPVAVLLSAPVLFPAFDRLLISFVGLSFKQNYNLIEFFGKMLPATYDGLIGNRFPYLFIGMIPLLLLPIFFLCKKIPVREKIAFGILLFVLYFTFSVNVTAAFWDLFADPDGYAFVAAAVFPALFLALSARALENADRSSERVLVSIALTLTVLISILQRMDLSFEVEGGGKTVRWFSEINSVWIPLPFLAIGCAGLLALIRARQTSSDRAGKPSLLLSFLLVLATVLDVAVSNAALAGVIAKTEGTDLSATEGTHAYTSAYLAAYSSGVNAAVASDGLFRADKFDAKTVNDASYLGYASASTLPPEILSAFGIEYDEKGVLKTVASPLSLSLFGVRYVMTHEPIETKAKEQKRLKKTTTETPVTYDIPGAIPDSIAPFYELIYRDDAGCVYDNIYALPIVFRAAAIPDGSILSNINATPYSRINEVFRTLTGDASLSLYVPAEISSITTPYCNAIDSDHPGYSAYERNSSNGAATVIYNVTVTNDGPLFCSFPTEYPLTVADVRLDGRMVGRAYLETETEEFGEDGKPIVNVTPNAYYLGTFEAGDTVKVGLSFGAGVDGTVCYLPENLPFVYAIDSDAVDAAFARLASGVEGVTLSGDIVVAAANGADLPAVVSTLPASNTRLRGGEPSAFLGCFAAGTGDEAVSISLSLGGLPVYLLSLLGVLLLGVLLFFESLAERGAKIPLVSRAAGGNAKEGST